MKSKLPLLLLLVASLSSAQYLERAPWMHELTKTKNLASKQEDVQYSIDEITHAFEEYWDGKDWKKKGSGFKPYKRWENYWNFQVDHNGHLPTAKQLLESWKNKQNSNMVPNPVANWTAIGPFTPGTLASALPGTGRINAMAVDPNDPNIWYAGAPAGGIWKSTNAGSTWSNLFDDFLQIGVSGIAIDANDSNTIYIATGDDDAADSYSVGVFKSTDGGTTWSETGLGPSTDANWGNNRLMSEITIDPTNSNVIWVATNFGLYKSIDAGATWNLMQSGNITDFRLKPGDSNTVYAISNTSFYRTEDGENFTSITDNLPSSSGRRVLDVTPADPNIVYLLTAKTSADDYEYQGFYKSTDSGQTFTESPNTVDIMESSQAWFDLALAASPTDADEVYMGCLNVWKSINGGDNFSKLNNWFIGNNAYTHADIHTLKFFNGILFAGTDGGLYTTTDGGGVFTDKTGDMAITQFYRITVAKANSNRLAGGTQDNAGYVGNGTDWNVYTGGDGMDYEIDPNNEDVIYGFSQFGGALYITNDAGESVAVVGAPDDENNDPLEGNWITPLAIDSNGDVFSGFFQAIYKLVGNSWEKWSEDFGSNNIDDIEIDPNDPMVMYAADGRFIYRSEDGGQTFTTFRFFDSSVSDFAINSRDGSAIYVTTSNRVGTSQAGQPNLRGVYRVPVNPDGTAGASENITLNLPTDQAYYSIVHQGRHTQNPIYVGTNLGVYRLDDSLTEWEEYFEGLPNTSMSDLDISLEDEKITVSTYGRGVFQSPIPIEVPEDDVRIVSVSPTFDTVLCGEIIPEVEVENKGTNTVSSIDVEYAVNNGTVQTFTWDGTLASGETTTITLPSLNSTTLGTNEFDATVSIANDAYSDNNSLSSAFVLNQFGTGGDIVDFDSESESLITYNEIGAEESVWERGVPIGTLLNTATSGTQVYGTNLDGNHSDATKGVLLSGCYELSSIIAPVLKFNMAFDLEINYDIVYVEYTLDGGQNWSVLGELGSQPNWYNSNRTNANSGSDNDCQNCPGAQWTGTNATMTEYAYDFVANAAAGETDLTNESNVIFRIVFHSDPNVNQEGVIIDDFVVEGVQDDDDDDNDGILDVDDNCPLIGNADQADNDGDGIGDVCDEDDDNDGILDVDDNCQFIANADQADDDGDGIGNLCDDDADNDGVPNSNDLCPDTPENSTVDINGCVVFSLPMDNFSVQVIGESCISSDNGVVNIEAVEELDYSARLIGQGLDVTNIFTQSTSFIDLATGSYEICISVAGQSDYEFCTTALITEPEDLSVFSKISSLNNDVELQLSGGDFYTITLNGRVYETAQSTITLPLDKIENIITVKTNLACQGIYEETIILSDEFFVYPNPIASGSLKIYLGNEATSEAALSLFSSNGRKIMVKTVNTPNNIIEMNVDGLAKGIYLLNVKTNNTLKNYKIIKR